MTTPTIAVLGALDTKGAEVGFLAEQIRRLGCRTLVVDLGVMLPPPFRPEVCRETIAKAAGTDIETLVARADRGHAVASMARGVRNTVEELCARGSIHGVIGIGGSAGTTMATAAMRALPIGVPKVMVSTIASGDVGALVGRMDIVMVPSIVDISGLNRISRQVFVRAAAAVAGMALAEVPPSDDREVVAASMFGNTTECVEAARSSVEASGFEVLVFHATGSGGRTMEDLIAAGLVSGVLDITTTELADELVGGVMSAGAGRLGAAASAGIPAAVVPGCMDMVNFWAPRTVPRRHRDRRLYRHNPNVTLMRTDPDENRELGMRLATRLNASKGPVAVYLPLKGVSVISAAGQPFHWPEADRALFAAIKRTLRPDIPLLELDFNINDPRFAETVANGLLRMMAGQSGPGNARESRHNRGGAR